MENRKQTVSRIAVSVDQAMQLTKGKMKNLKISQRLFPQLSVYLHHEFEQKIQ